MSFRYWLLFTCGILLFGLIIYAERAYPHGSSYPTDETQLRYDRQEGEVWEEDESQLKNPDWVMLLRHYETLFFVGSFALMVFAGIKSQQADRKAIDKSKKLLFDYLVAHNKGAAEDIPFFIHDLKVERAKRLSSNVWYLSFYRYEHGFPIYTWLVDIKHKTVNAKTKAAELLSEKTHKEILA